jgi:AraC family transcriptional regulator
VRAIARYQQQTVELTMKVMVIVKASADSEAGKMPSQQLLAEMGTFNDELAKAGILLAAEGLHPSSKGVRVSFGGKERTVTEGPFMETKELIAGYWLWKVKSTAEAVEWVKRCPNPHNERGEIEIRPVLSPDDFGSELTPELREQEASTRARALGLGTVRFETAGERSIAGLNNTYDAESRKNIPAQWGRFAPHIGRVPGQIGLATYGVCWNFRPECVFDYLSGVEVAESAKSPPDFTRVALPASRYAVATHEGHISQLPQTIDKIWTQWIPDSSLKPAKAPCFERYDENFDPHSGLGRVEIWIPLEA